jgi:hypothetical protein
LRSPSINRLEAGGERQLSCGGGTEVTYRNITVSLHSPSGVLLDGRTFTVDVHRDLTTISTRLISWSSVVLGVVLPLLRTIGIIR